MSLPLLEDDIITEQPLGKDWVPAGVRLWLRRFVIGKNYPCSISYLRRRRINAMVVDGATIRCRKLDQIHLEIISLRKRLVLVNPDMDNISIYLVSLSKHAEVPASAILFSKFYMLIGDLLEDWEKLPKISHAIENNKKDTLRNFLQDAEVKLERKLRELIDGKL